MCVTVDAEVPPFIDSMDEAYARADWCYAEPARQQWRSYGLRQSGDSVPYPYAIYDHERGNAGAA